MANRISELFRDAIELEINSMVVEGISGRKMPGVTAAFLETVSAWGHQLNKFCEDIATIGIKVDAFEIIKAKNAFNLKKKDLFLFYVIEEKKGFPDIDTEDQIKDILNIDKMSLFREKIAEKLAKKRNVESYNMELFRLLRIQTRLAIIMGRLLKHCDNQGVPLIGKGTQELRKLWELKDGYIFAKTSMQLDGDIVTKYNQRIYRDKSVKDNVVELFDFHQRNIDMGLQHWHFIFETIQKIVNVIKDAKGAIANPFTK